MKKEEKLQISNRSIYRRVKQETFTIGSNCLVVEDRIHLFIPERSERILRLAGTEIFYSMVPLDPDRHRLLCYQYCSDAMDLRKPEFYRHALVLGCGGGAIPRWLLEEYPALTVDVVDYSAEMIRVCRKYFMEEWEDSPRLSYYCIDAQDYMPPDYPYQFVFCDLFDGTELVPFVYSIVFAAKLRSMIGDGGILVINCGWHHMDQVLRVYRAVFAHVQMVERKSWQTEVAVVSDGELPYIKSR